uniref:Uncharacterized protein n=1 Tax=Arion vulgaris TaxID=1028688 RepID=A0A0B7BK65_9EUPU
MSQIGSVSSTRVEDFVETPTRHAKDEAVDSLKTNWYRSPASLTMTRDYIDCFSVTQTFFSRNPPHGDEARTCSLCFLMFESFFILDTLL